MKKTLFCILAALLLLTVLAACEEKPQAPAGPASVSAYKSQGQFPEIKEQLTWERINAFPVKTENMAVEDARKLCVDFFRFAKTALWTPDEDLSYIRNKAGNPDEMKKGTIYGGLPYIGLGSGNIYRLMDYMDPETGVVDISNAADVLKSFGNQCSIGAWWGWARVVNSSNYKWSQTCLVSHGMLRVGPYTYDDTLDELVVGYGTKEIISENDQQTLFQSYAALKPGDGLVWYLSSGHVVMCSSEPTVVYNDDGTIDGENSYITIIDQGMGWKDGTSQAGDAYQYKTGVDVKKTFFKLESGGFLPFTFKEFTGDDPIEKTEVSFSHQGDTITREQLFATKVTSNYSISDIYALVYDGKGNEVYKHAVRCIEANTEELAFTETAAADAVFDNVEVWGTLKPGTYTVKIVVQLGTGERPTVYEGTLTV